MIEPAGEPAASAHEGAPHRALYRAWRAQRFADLIGQDPIVTTLRHAVESGRFAHAYLFVGPRGTGKTSTARLLAKAVNCNDLQPGGEPCDRCPACVAIRDGRAMDVIEIDAASHGLVEDARDLVMRALTAPSELRRRVYIIDEVHMLSTHAFNALLKLIEEPPDHVVFVLATTDTHKVPATIISRTQRFDFRRLPVDLIVSKLERICAAERVVAERPALELLARLADGAMRDAESLLDQVLAYAGSDVTLAAAREAVGLAEEEAITELVDAYVAGDAAAALDVVGRLADAGREMAQVAAQATDEARRRLLSASSDPMRAGALAAILRRLAEAAGIGAREGRAGLLLELLAVERSLAQDAPVPSDRPAAAAPPRAPATPATPRAMPATPRATPQPPTSPTAATAVSASASAARSESGRKPKAGREQEPPEPVAGPPAPATQDEARVAAPARATASRPPSGAAGTAGDAGARPSLENVRSRWGEVVERATPVVKPLLRESRPISIEGARLTLAFPEGREFMRSRITARADSIEQLLGALFGGSWTLECVAASVELEPLSIEDAVRADSSDPEAARALLEGVLRITGGELLDVREVH